MKPGDSIQVLTKDETVTGTLIQSPKGQDHVIIIKLKSGYNIGIDKKKVISTRLLKAGESKSDRSVSKVEKKAKFKTIAILHTGGTIASKVDYKSGGVTSNFSAGEMLDRFPELRQIANISSRKIASMQSEMMRFSHYNLMAKEIVKEIKNGADGIIVTHGTDTLHCTSAALSFMLENLPVPVLLVGAQRSSDRGSSDAAVNLISAAYFISNTKFSGVGICMHESMDDHNCLILPAAKTRKMHTSRRDAFKPINAKAIARVNYREENVSMISKTKQPGGRLEVRNFKPDIMVGLIKARVNMFASELDLFSSYDGLVIEGTGMGHLPNEAVDEFTKENARIQKSVESLAKKGVVIVMAPQTIYGRLQMNVYAPQRRLRDAGVLGHLSDMTPETTYIKLAWLLSNYNKDQVRKLITKDLRGEISSRTEAN